MPETKGRVQSTSVASRQNTYNFYTTPQRRGQRNAHLLKRYNGFVSLFYSVPAFSNAELKYQRLDRIQSTLSSDLDHFFTATVTSIVDGTGSNKTSEIDKAKLMADLAECLRAYDMLGLWQDAEEILQKQVVRGFVRKVCPCTRSSITVPDLTLDHFPWRTSCPSFTNRPSYTFPRSFFHSLSPISFNPVYSILPAPATLVSWPNLCWHPHFPCTSLG